MIHLRLILGAALVVLPIPAMAGPAAVMLTANAGSEGLAALDMLCAYRPDIHKKDWRGRSVVREARDLDRNSGKPQMREILERHFPGTDFELA